MQLILKLENMILQEQGKGSSLVAEGYFPSRYSGSGSYLWATASPLIDHDGRRMGVIEIIHDISRIKELYQLLKNAKTGFIPGSDEEIFQFRMLFIRYSLIRIRQNPCDF